MAGGGQKRRKKDGESAGQGRALERETVQPSDRSERKRTRWNEEGMEKDVKQSVGFGQGRRNIEERTRSPRHRIGRGGGGWHATPRSRTRQ
jgi:hypothetical protein